jgi:hypothetical protein
VLAAAAVRDTFDSPTQWGRAPEPAPLEKQIAGQERLVWVIEETLENARQHLRRLKESQPVSWAATSFATTNARGSSSSART